MAHKIFTIKQIYMKIFCRFQDVFLREEPQTNAVPLPLTNLNKTKFTQSIKFYATISGLGIENK